MQIFEFMVTQKKTYRLQVYADNLLAAQVKVEVGPLKEVLEKEGVELLGTDETEDRQLVSENKS